MNTKNILVILFVLFNALTLVYAQNNKEPTDGQKNGNEGDNKNPVQDNPVATSSTTTPIANNQPTTTTTSSAAKEAQTKPNPNPAQPTTTSPMQVVTTTTNPVNNGGGVKQQTTTTQAVKQVTTTKGVVATTPKKIVTSIVQIENLSGMVKTTNIAPVKVATAAPTQQQAATTVSKRYQQTEFKEYESDEKELKEESNSKYLKYLYIISAVMCTALIGVSTFTLYKKGFGDENSNASKTWESSFDDDGYRNKSTISRNTLNTPSIRNATLNTNPSNPRY